MTNVDIMQETIFIFDGGRWQPVSLNPGGSKGMYKISYKNKTDCEKYCNKINRFKSDEAFFAAPKVNGMDIKLYYNSKYEWQMKVVDKIERLGYTVRIEGCSVQVYRTTSNQPAKSEFLVEVKKKSKKEALFYGMFQFINYHNARNRFIKSVKPVS